MFYGTFTFQLHDELTQWEHVVIPPVLDDLGFSSIRKIALVMRKHVLQPPHPIF